MNDLQQLIREISRVFSQADLTESEDKEKLAKRYAAACVDFNKKLEECQKQIDRKMFVEAEAFANSESPSLKMLAAIHDFPERNEFLELIAMYGWEEPPQLRTDVLDTLKNTVLGQKDLNPLVSAYRKIARGTDTPAKINLLRKIFSLSPTPEWKETLTSLETARLQDLTSQAKTAICDNEIIRLKEIYLELSAAEWLVKPNHLVMTKIESVLEKDKQEALKKIAEHLLNQINDAYSNFDYDALNRTLPKWKNLTERDHFVPEETAAQQVQEAQNYYSQQKDIREQDALFESLVQSLRSGVEKESPLHDLENIYTQAKMMDRPIPEAIEREFLSYQQTVEAQLKRKKIIQISVAVGIICILTVIGVCVVSYIVLENMEEEWKARIGEAVEKDQATVALSLLEDLEKLSPKVRKRGCFIELEEKAKEKLDLEEKKRAAFKVAVDQIRGDLRDYKRNKDTLLEKKVKAQKLIVDGTEEQVYIQVEKECQVAHQKYEAEQNKIYLLLIERLQHLRKKFFASLELEKYDETEKILAEINDVQQEAKSIADVSQQVKTQNSRYIDSIAELREKLQKERERIAKSEQMLADVFKAGTVKDVKKKIEAYLADFADRPAATQLYVLQKNLSTIEKNAPEDPKWLQKDSIFHASAERYAKLQGLSEKLLRDVRSKYEKMADAYREDPQYAVIFTSNGIMYDFYFPKSDLPKWSRCGDEVSFRVNVQMNEDGKKENIKFILAERRGTKISAFFNSGEASEAKASGTPIYPQRISFRQPIGDFLAPHIRYVQKLAMELKRAEQENIEQTMVDAIATLLANETITPYLKVEFCSQMAKMLTQCVPDNKTYADLSERAEKSKKAVSGKFNWMASYNDPEIQKQLRQDVIDLGVVKLKVDPSFVIERKILDTALTRKIIPIGYVRETPKGMELKKFDSALPSGEVWIAVDGKPYWKIVGTYSDSVLTLNSEAKKELSDMQILYAPQDSRSTEKLKKALEQDAKKLNVNSIIWPDIWPKVAGEK